MRLLGWGKDSYRVYLTQVDELSKDTARFRVHKIGTDRRYIIRFQDDGEQAICSCPSGRRGVDCRHRKMLKTYVPNAIDALAIHTLSEPIPPKNKPASDLLLTWPVTVICRSCGYNVKREATVQSRGQAQNGIPIAVSVGSAVVDLPEDWRVDGKHAYCPACCY